MPVISETLDKVSVSTTFPQSRPVSVSTPCPFSGLEESRSRPEVHKVPEPANLVHRKFWKISLLAENFYQNPCIKNTETFTGIFRSHRKFSDHINLQKTTH